MLVVGAVAVDCCYLFLIASCVCVLHVTKGNIKKKKREGDFYFSHTVPH